MNIITHRERVARQARDNDRQDAATYLRMLALASAADERGDCVLAHLYTVSAQEYRATRMADSR